MEIEPQGVPPYLNTPNAAIPPSLDTNTSPIDEGLLEGIFEQAQDAPKPLEPGKVAKNKKKEAPDIKTLEKAAKELEEHLGNFTRLLEEENVEKGIGNRLAGGFVEAYGYGSQMNSIASVIQEKAIELASYLKTDISKEDKYKADAHKKLAGLLSNVSNILDVVQKSSLLIQKKELIKERKELLAELIKETAPEIEQAKKDLKANQEALKEAIVKGDEGKPYVKQLESEIQYQKTEILSQENAIRALKESIQELIYETNEESKKTILQTFEIAPSLASNTYTVVKFFGNVADQAAISSAIGLIGPAVNIARAAYDLGQKTEAERSHGRHIRDLNSPQLKDIPPPSAEKDISPPAEEEEIITLAILKNDVLSRIKRYEERSKELHKNQGVSAPEASVISDEAKFFCLEQEFKSRRLKLDPDMKTYQDFENALTGLSEQDIKFRKGIEEQLPQRKLTDTQQAFKNLLSQRQAVKQERMAEELTWFKDLAARYESKNDFPGFAKKMAEEGIMLDDSIQSFEGLTDSVKNSLVDKHIEYKDTLTVTAKAQLKARLKAHEEINHDFYEFKLKKSKYLFGITVAISTISFVLAAGLIAGIAFPAAILAIPTILGVAVGVGTIAIGLYYLHQKKPNLAKTYMRLVPMQIMANSIPLLFADLALKINEWREDSLADDINKIAQKAFEKGTTETFTEEELDKQSEDLKNVNDSITYWTALHDKYKEKVDGLEAEVLQARKDDFELKTGFKSFSGNDLTELDGQLEKMKKQKADLEEAHKKVRLTSTTVQNKEGEFETHVESKPHSLTKKDIHELEILQKQIEIVEGKIAKLQQKGADEFTIIAEALIKGEFWKDPAAAALIKKYGGVELEKELKLESSTLEENKTFLSQRLRDLILRNSKEILEWLEKQNIHEVQV